MSYLSAITRTYERAVASGYADDGHRWYQDAHAIALALDPTDPTRGAGVLAALSPRVNWERNIVLAVRAFTDGRASGTLGANRRAADRILAGEHPLSVLGGPKTRDFYRLIANPADTHTVCVDRHAYAIARGTYDGQAASLTARQYDAVADAYRAAARLLSRRYGRLIRPSDVQATTWLYWRAEVKPNRQGLG